MEPEPENDAPCLSPALSTGGVVNDLAMYRGGQTPSLTRDESRSKLGPCPRRPVCPGRHCGRVRLGPALSRRTASVGRAAWTSLYGSLNARGTIAVGNSPPQETATGVLGRLDRLGRKVGFGTCRFAASPRFAMRLLTRSASGEDRWLRLGRAADIATAIFGWPSHGPANDDALVSVRTADKRSRSKNGEMETSHDAYGSIFADVPHPGGLEQPF